MTEHPAGCPLPVLSPAEGPAVTCLCPTYGRFQLLRRALACFLAQDYPNKRLLILNDAPMPIVVSDRLSITADQFHVSMNTRVVNAPAPFATLGEKRQALLKLAVADQSKIRNQESSMLCAHWDDDDLYLPWHLSRSVAALLGGHGALSGASVGARLAVPAQAPWGCVKSRGAWYMVGDQIRGEIHHNVFEGSMLFRRKEALALGGYPPLHSGQAKALMKAFLDADRLYKIPDHESFAGSCLLPRLREGAIAPRFGAPAAAPCPLPSYVYCWAQPGAGHISAFGNKPASLERFHAANQDFGLVLSSSKEQGQPLTPADLTRDWDALLDAARKALSKPDYETFEHTLGAARVA